MKKSLIRIIVGLAIIIVIILLLNKLLPYTEKDIKRTNNIYLGRTNPDIFDYMRLDRNNDKVIDLADSVITINEVNHEE